MKNYHFKLFIIMFTSLLSGCSLVHLVESVALLPVAVVDGVIGTKMHSGITSGLNELEKPGSKMDKQTAQTNLSGKTIYPYSDAVYLNANGESLFKRSKDGKISKYRWTAKDDGVFCVAIDSCYDFRKSGDTILYGYSNSPLTIKNGDVENLTVLFAEAEKKEAEKRAEMERKQAEEKVAQERAEAEQKVAQEKADAERKLAEQKAEAEQKRLAAIEERCMKTPSCRAKKERAERIETARRDKEERQRQIVTKQESKRACNGFYVGKTFTEKRKIRFGFGLSTSHKVKIVGIDKEEGLLSLELSDRTLEATCTQLREMLSSGDFLFEN